MTDKIVKIVDKNGNAKSWSPLDAIKSSEEILSPGGVMENSKKCIVVMLDDNDEDYHMSYRQSGMKCSECIALLTIAIADMRRDMGY